MFFFPSQAAVSKAKSQASIMQDWSCSSQNFSVVPQIMPQAWRCWQHGSTSDSPSPSTFGAENACMWPPLMESHPPVALTLNGRFGTASVPFGHVKGTQSRARPPAPARDAVVGCGGTSDAAHRRGIRSHRRQS